MSKEIYFPVRELYPTRSLPLAGIMSDSFDNIWITQPSFDSDTQIIRLGIFIQTELALRIPGIDSLTLAIAPTAGGTALGLSIELSPFRFSLKSAPIMLRIDAELLRPVKPGDKPGTWEPDLNAKTLDIDLGTIDFVINGDGDIKLDLPSGRSALPRCMVGKTGIILEIGSLRWLTPSTPPTNLPLAPTVVPPGFTGMFLDDVTVYIPQLPVSKIRMDDVFLGASGFSGHVSGQWIPQLGSEYLFSWYEIPGNDNEKLIEFLKRKYGFDEIKDDDIKKINDNTKTASDGNKTVSLKLNNEKTKINIEIDDGRTDELIVEKENDKLKIYCLDMKSFAPGDGVGTIFGIPFALKVIDLEFKQNILIKSNIRGTMIFPFFDQPANVEIGLSMNGDFTIALSEDQSLPAGVPQPDKVNGFYIFTKKDLIKLTVKGMGFEHKEGKFLINISGSIQPLLRSKGIKGIPPLKWPEFDVKSLSIDSEGNVKLDGGWVNLPNQKSFSLYGFSANFTQIGFGNEADGSRWIGFSGGIKLVDGLPLEGSVEGLKIIWGPVGIRMAISGIKVGFEIKNVLEFKGAAIFIDEPNKWGFRGGMKIVLYPLNKCSLDVQLMVGKNTSSPPYTFFYIYINADLPIGIPLFSTGLALYGMAGLFGYNIEPNKGKPPYDVNEAWYENEDGSNGWYLREPIGITDTKKWIDNYESMVFGAGITLGTAADNGYSFSAKTLLVFLIPGPTIIMQGKVNFLKERKDLEDNPLFRVMAAYDPKVGTFQMNIGADYWLPEKEKYTPDGKKVPNPDGGKVLKMDNRNLAEVFFDFNRPDNWHLYFGQDQPTERRVRATILSFFEANAYFMLDHNTCRTGAWVGFNKEWPDFKPLYVKLNAWIEGSLVMSIKPRQAYGELTLHGYVHLSAFGFSGGIEANALVKVQTPNPFCVHAEFYVRLDLPDPFPDLSKRIIIQWPPKPDLDVKPPVPMPLAKFGIEHLNVTEKWTLEKYPKYDSNGDGFLDNEESPPPWDDAMEAQVLQTAPVIPLDSKPVIVFGKSVEDVALVGNNPTTIQEEKVGDHSFKYNLLKIKLERKPRQGSGNWVPISIKSQTKSENVNEDKFFGSWQAVPDSNQVNTKLMLWSLSAFSISRELESNNILYEYINQVYNPCDIYQPKVSCVDFEDEISETSLPLEFNEDGIIFSGKYPSKLIDYNAPWADTTKALVFCSIHAEAKRLNVVKYAFADDVSEAAAAGLDRTGSGQAFENGNYIAINRQGEKYVALNGKINKLAKLLIEQGEATTDKKTLQINEDWDMGDGWILSARQAILIKSQEFDQEVGPLLLTLSSKDRIIGEKVIYQGKIYTYFDKSIAGETDVPIFVTYIDSIFSGETTDFVQLRYSWLISESIAVIEDRDKFKITFPEPVARIDIYFGKGSLAMVEALDEKLQPAIFREVNIPIDAQDSDMRPVTLEGNIKELLLTGSGLISKICYTTTGEIRRAAASVLLKEHIKRATELHWNEHREYIFEPDMYYRLTVETEAKRNCESIPSDHITERAYFQTEKPPGVYPASHAGIKYLFCWNEDPIYKVKLVEYLKQNYGASWVEAANIGGIENGTLKISNQDKSILLRLEDTKIILIIDDGRTGELIVRMENGKQNIYGISEHYPTAGPLKDLSVYVSRTIPKAGEKPVYCSYDIGLIFNVDYVEQMYLMANLPLTIQLFDNNNQPVVDIDGKPVILDNQWGDNPQIFLTREEEQWINKINVQGCAYLDYTKKSNTQNLYSGHKNMILKPETLYKAKVVAGTDQDKYVIYQFSFITSKYLTFIHQIHSFQDIAWSYYELLGSGTPLLTTEDKTNLESILADIGPGNPYQPDIESKKFEQINELFRLGIRQLPSSLEVLALDDSFHCYGFLIESPEPIDWRRTTMRAYSSNYRLIEEAYEPIKIIGACISDSGSERTNFNNEWVDILLRESYDINDLVVKHKHMLDVYGFQIYFSFSSEKPLPAGTIIRIHSGKKEDDTNASPEIEHRYLGLNNWKFASTGEIIQLENKQNKVFYTRYIYSANNLFSKSVICIRNSDNTRVFVFFSTSGEKAGNIEKGNYRFDFKFKRNIGDGEPILKRIGRDSDEETYIEFSFKFKTGSIAGIVIDKDTYVIIKDAGISTDTGQTAGTDEEGFYYLGDVPIGNRLVTASKEGYKPVQTIVIVEKDKEVTSNFELIYGSKGEIIGKVIDKFSQKLIDGAEVSTDTGQIAMTDPDGNYKLSNIKIGKYLITATKDNCKSGVMVIIVKKDQVTNSTLELVCGDHTGEIIGWVMISGTKRPIMDTEVSVDTGQTAVTDANGKYKLSGVLIGDRLVTASGEGNFKDASTIVTVEENKVVKAPTLELGSLPI